MSAIDFLISRIQRFMCSIDSQK